MNYISEAKANEFFESNCMYIEGCGDLILRRDAAQLLCMAAIKHEKTTVNDTVYEVYDGSLLADGIECYTHDEFMRAVTRHNYCKLVNKLESEDLSDEERRAVEFIEDLI